MQSFADLRAQAELGHEEEGSLPRRRRRRRWAILWIVLVGLLIFAHGCHGEDHDDELGIGGFDGKPAKTAIDDTHSEPPG